MTTPVLRLIRNRTERFARHHAGCTFHYALEGSGAPVLFIHGVGIHGDGWRPQVDALMDRFTCMTFDNRGMGRSQPQFLAITVEQMAEDARAMMHAAHWSSAHVVGHGLGGLVALQLALSQPYHIRSLSLLCSFANGRSSEPLTARLLWLGLRSRVGTRAMRRTGYLERLVPLKQGKPMFDESLLEELPGLFGHDLADRPPIVDAQLRAMRECNLVPVLGGLDEVPTIILCGAHDPIAPPSAAREIAAGIAGARLVEFADASHGLPITHADDVNTLLIEHLMSAEARWAARPAGGPS
jgi:pimeloyl-ACP methyl ester carboxylesterase